MKPPSAEASPVSERVPHCALRPGLQRTGRQRYYYGRFPEIPNEDGKPKATAIKAEKRESGPNGCITSAPLHRPLTPMRTPTPTATPPHDEMDTDSDCDPDILTSPHPIVNYVTEPARSTAEEEYRLRLARLVVRKWMRLAGVQPKVLNADEVVDAGEEFAPPWTSGIAPKVEGRIVVVEDGLHGSMAMPMANGDDDNGKMDAAVNGGVHRR